MPLANGLHLLADFGAGWVSITSETVSREGWTWKRGMAGGGPHDLVAVTGVCAFTLANGPTADNPSRPVGYYSLTHANVRSGWTFGTPIRVAYGYGGSDYALWTGTLYSAMPAPGQYQSRSVQCEARDSMNALAETDMRGVSPQVNQTENALIAAAIAALPTSAQPSSVAYDSTLDSYPYAFDDASSGTKAMSLIAQVCASARCYYYPLGDGSIRVENRQARGIASVAFDFDETHLLDLEVPGDTSVLANRVRAVTHPRSVDAAATTVLFGITQAALVPAGETITIWGDYRNPDQTKQPIGGTAQVTSLVSGTDYAARANADGSGADLVANISITATAFAATVKFEVENTGGTDAYLVTGAGVPLLQIRGKGIYDDAPQSYEASSTQDYGERLLVLDLPYQDDGPLALDLATFTERQRRLLSEQVTGLSYTAWTNALIEAAVTLEIGDVITVTETMTGLDELHAAIHAIEMSVVPPQTLQVRYTLAPLVSTTSLILDDDDYGELDSPLALLGFL